MKNTYYNKYLNETQMLEIKIFHKFVSVLFYSLPLNNVQLFSNILYIQECFKGIIVRIT
jgi:hypothetical protein